MTKKVNRALLVIDVQNDYIGGKLPIEFPEAEQSLAHIGRAMDAARECSVPVIVVQHENPADAPFMAKATAGANLHSVVATRPRDHFIQKNQPDAFWQTDLEKWLLSQKIDTVTVAGYMTHNCDLSTIIHGMHAGFSMELLADATGSLPYANRAGYASAEEIHRVITVVLQSRFAAVLSTEEWISLLHSGDLPDRETIFSSNRNARKRNG